MTENLAEVLASLQRNSNGSGPVFLLSADTRARLLRWYNGNPFNTEERTLKQALKVFLWCEENSDLFEYPPEMRLARLRAEAQTLEISVNHLADLMARENIFNQPPRTERLIAFEGIDDAENIRQVNLLRAYLVQRQVNVVSIPYPNYTGFFGREIARMQSGDDAVQEYNVDPKSMALWHALDRKDTVSEILRQAPNSVVLCNRYTLSNAVYQSVRSNIDLADWIFQMEHTHLGIPAPDMYVVLDIRPSCAQVKGGPSVGSGVWPEGKEESSRLMAAALQRYHDFAIRFPQLKVIDCMANDQRVKTPDEIHLEVLSCLSNCKLLD